MDLLKLSILVFFGGGIGSLARFGLSKIQFQLLPENFPTATLITNILACAILGFIVFLFKDKLDESIWIKYFLVIGFCGGFSTFSTFGFETVNLLKSGFFVLAISNIVVSLGLGFFILWTFTRA